ncbi:MAG: MFS transporter [Candidatus Bruticola sp.]
MSVLSNIFSIFKPAASIAPQYKNEDDMRRQYGYWRLRQLYSTFVGYGVFYFVRKNISIAIPLLESSLGISKAAIGMIVSVSDVVYGVSKFVNGFLGDRCNARYFMAVGLLLSALANFMFGMSSAVGVLLVAWVLNGWFQGMGSPPCSRVICHWFSSKERGTYWSIWNTSHQIGLSLILIMGGYLGEYYGWRYVFCVPAAIAALTSLFLLERMRDTPASMGLPDPEVYTKEKPFIPIAENAENGAADGGQTESQVIETEENKQSSQDFFRFLCRHVFNNPYIWAVCLANFFIYILRYGFVTWGPSYLSARGVALSHAGVTMAFFEIAGIAGSLLAGWMTDHFFKGKRAPVCAYYTIASLISIFVFWKLPTNSSVLVYSLMFVVTGFFIYGPQLLVAVMATDFATKKAAATAVGMTGLFGYLSSIVSGWGMGKILDAYGWDTAFQMLLGCALLSVLPFIFAWRAKPNNLEELEAEDSLAAEKK